MTLEEINELNPRTRILVTGGSGSVGSEVLGELYQHKNWYDVKVLDRNTPEVLRKLKPYRRDFHLILGDISDSLIVDKAATDVDFVIHLAAIIPPAADRNPDLAEKINVEGTRNLIRALEKLSPKAFFLYSSSVSIYGDRVRSPWISVDDPLLPSEGDKYAVTKIQAERLIGGSRLRWSIFRLTAIMGMQTRMDPLFFNMPLDTSLEIATARDTGYAMVEAFYHQDEIRGKIFNLSGGPACRTSYREFLDHVFRIKGLKEVDFPKHAFAEKNFHCGYFTDSEILNSILHFQRDSLTDFYEMLHNMGKGSTRRFISAFNGLIKGYLVRKSEPLKALRKGNEVHIHRFYYSQVPR
ncbi:MAG: NAD(P)-dependent oxidoreductase [Bacteroidota bacterium]